MPKSKKSQNPSKSPSVLTVKGISDSLAKERKAREAKLTNQRRPRTEQQGFVSFAQSLGKKGYNEYYKKLSARNQQSIDDRITAILLDRLVEQGLQSEVQFNIIASQSWSDANKRKHQLKGDLPAGVNLTAYDRIRLLIDSDDGNRFEQTMQSIIDRAARKNATRQRKEQAGRRNDTIKSFLN